MHLLSFFVNLSFAPSLSPFPSLSDYKQMFQQYITALPCQAGVCFHTFTFLSRGLFPHANISTMPKFGLLHTDNTPWQHWSRHAQARMRPDSQTAKDTPTVNKEYNCYPHTEYQTLHKVYARARVSVCGGVNWTQSSKGDKLWTCWTTDHEAWWRYYWK